MSESKDHLIRILVKAIVEGRGKFDELGREIERLTGAQDKHAASTKKDARTVDDARKDYEKFTASVKRGEKDYESARLGLSRLAAEFEKLSKAEPVGSKQSEDMNKMAIAARRLSGELKAVIDHDAETRAADAKKRVKLADDVAKAEVKAQEESSRRRQQLVKEMLKADQKRENEEGRAAKRAEAEQKKRSAAYLAEVRREIEAEAKVRRDAERLALEHKIKESVRDAQRQGTDIAPGTGNNMRNRDRQQSIITRVIRFVTRDDGGLKRWREDLDGVDGSTKIAERGMSRLERTMSRLSNTADKSGFSLAKVDNNLRGIMVVGVIFFAEQLISSLVSLAGLFTAVASSAAQAGAAMGGALVAGIGQAVPAVGVLVAAFRRIGAVFDAVKLFNKQARKSGYDQSQAAEAQASAADRLASSQEQVASAAQRVADATDGLTDARERARRKIEDLNLAERSSSRSAFESQQALNRAAASGDIGAIERLTISRDQSSLESSRASGDASSARSAGIGRSEEVLQATQTLDEANKALRRARREADAAGRAATRAAETGSAADRSLEQALAQLSAAELGLYESFLRIQKKAQVVFRPITDLIVSSFARATDRVTAILDDPRVVKPLTRIGQAISDSIDTISERMTSAKGLNFFETMANEAARNIPLLTELALKINDVFSNIAVAAGPAFRKFLDFLIEMATKASDATGSESGLSKLERFFLRGEEMAESFVHLGIAIIDLFAAIAGAGGAETGADTIEDLTRTLREAAVWVRRNREEVAKFFSDSQTASYAIGKALFALGAMVMRVFRSESVEELSKAFTNILLPALEATITIFGAFTTIFLKFINLDGVSQIAAFALAWAGLFKIFKILGSILPVMSKGTEVLLSKIPLLGAAFVKLGRAIGIAATLLTGKYGIALAAFTTAIYFLEKKFGFLSDAISGVGDAMDAVFGGGAGSALGQGALFLGTMLLTSKKLLGVFKSMAGLAGLTALFGGGKPEKPSKPAGGKPGSLLGKAGPIATAATAGYLLDSVVNPQTKNFKLPKSQNVAQDYLDTAVTSPVKSLGNFFGMKNEAFLDKDVRKFGDTAESRLKALSASNNTKGLQALAAQAREVAKSAGGAKDKFLEFANAAVKAAAESTKALRGSSQNKRLQSAANDIISGKLTWKSFLNRSGFSEESEQLVRDMVRAKSQTRTAAENIGGAFAFGLEKSKRPLRKSVNSLLETLSGMHPRAQKVAAETAIGMAAVLEEKKKLPAGSARKIRSAVMAEFSDLRVASVRSSRNNVGDIADVYRSGARPVGQAALAIARSVSGVLKTLGVDKAAQSVADTVRANPLKLIEKRAVGGWIGKQGERGKDMIHTLLGRGEVVLNGAQQRAANIAMAGRDSLGQIVDRVRGYHAGGPEEAIGYARGRGSRRPRQTNSGGYVQGAVPPRNKPAANLAQSLIAKGFSVTSGGEYRGTGTNHDRQNALDFGDSVNNLRSLWAVLKPRAQSFVELFGPTSFAGLFRNGRQFQDGKLQSDHEDHIHVAITGAIGKLLGGAGGTFNGGAGGDIQKAIPKIKAPKLGKEFFGLRGKVARATLKKVEDAANAYVQKMAGDGGDTTSMDDSPTGKGAGSTKQVRSWLYRGLKLAGVTPSVGNINTLFGRVMQESGGDPNAQNNWDSNAKAGDPSIGLLQTIGATFRQYMVKGHGNIRNPVDNVAAAVRYMLARYGKLVGRGSGGYEHGGAVDGQGPQPSVLHGGEHVWTASEVAKAGGHGVMRAMRSMLGGGGQGGGEGYEKGGATAKPKTSYYVTPAIFNTSVGGIKDDIDRAQKLIRRIKTRSKDFITNFARSLESIAADGGLIDQGQDAVQTMADKMAARLKRLVYRVGPGGVVSRRMSERAQAVAEVGSIDQQRRGLQGLRRGAGRSLSDVDRRLGVLRKGGISDKERKSYDALVVSRRALVKQVDELDAGIAGLVESRYEAQSAALSAAVDDVNNRAQKTMTRADLSDRVASMVEGIVGGSSAAFGIRGSALQARRGALTQQRDALAPLLGRALRQGNKDVADALVAQIEELNVALAENSFAISANTIAARQSDVEAINRQAARALTRADLQDRVAALIEGSGNSAGAFALRGSTIAGRGAVLAGQRGALAGQLGDAQARFDGTQAAQDQIDALIDQISDLDVTLAENSAAVVSNTVAARQAAIDRITGRGGFLGGVFSGLGTILQTLGAVTGTLDINRLKALAQDAGQILQQTSTGLRDQLLGGFGVDLRGLSGNGLVDALRDLNFDAIESSLTNEQRQQFETLIQAIIDNEGAVAQNTQQLQELTGSQQQSFSSSAWQLFREAIFNGSGGLLPKYDFPPLMASGGTVLSEGLIYAHPGEVLNARVSRDMPRSGGDTYNISVPQPTEVLDPSHFATVLSYRRSLERAT